MTLDSLVECELRRRDWSRIIDAHGCASALPDTVRMLLRANTTEEANRIYWKLENRVFVQSSLFEAALALVPVLLAALVDMSRPDYVRGELLEVLFHIVNCDSHREETARGLGDLGDRCRAAAREGLWVLYMIFQEGDFWSVASDIIVLIDSDPARLNLLRAINAENGRVDVSVKPKLPPGLARP